MGWAQLTPLVNQEDVPRWPRFSIQIDGANLPGEKVQEKVASVVKDVTYFPALASFPSKFDRHNSRPNRPQHNSTSVDNKRLGRSSLQGLGRNKQRKHWEVECEAVASKIKVDAQRVQNCAQPQKGFVHCERILLSWMLSHPEKPFVNYIGVSKRWCRGCFQLIKSTLQMERDSPPGVATTSGTNHENPPLWCRKLPRARSRSLCTLM